MNPLLERLRRQLEEAIRIGDLTARVMLEARIAQELRREKAA